MRWIFVVAVSFFGLYGPSRLSGQDTGSGLPGAQVEDGLSQDEMRVLVVFHSGTGNTEAFAEAVCSGIRAVEMSCTLRRVSEVRDEDLDVYDGLIVGTPVHWADVSTPVKEFLDRLGASYFAQERVGPERTAASNKDYRTGGAFVTGGSPASGKELARLSILAALLNLRFVLVGGEDADGFGTLGAQATTGPSDPGLSEAELAEAVAFGRRFAEVTRQLRQ